MGKKIIILGTAHPFRGGLAAYNERLALEFIAEGDEVELVTFTMQYPPFLFPGTSQYSDQAAPIGLKIRELVNSINPFNWWHVGRMIKQEAPDILIIKFWLPFMAPCFGTIARIVKGNKKTRVVSILDNVIPHEKRIGDMQLIRYFVRSVDAFIAMSDSVMADLKKFDNQKPCILKPHPIYDNFGPAVNKETAIQQLGLAQGERYLLFFGFIRDYKGLDLLIEAMADARIKALGIKAIIAGEFYTQAQPYLDLIKKCAVDSSIILRTDFIPDDMVKYYFCASDIIVQPYKHATQSGVTQIGYHFEKPMIVTKVGGLAEIIPHGKAGYVVEVNAKSIADALVDFYENQREREIIEFVLQEKKKYAWGEMTKTIKSI